MACILGLSGCTLPKKDNQIGGISDVSVTTMAEKYNASTDIKQKYQLDGTSLSHIAKDDDKDRIKVIIGNMPTGELGAESDFVPSARIERWDNEVSFTLKPDLSAIATKDKKLSFDKDKIIFDTPKVKYQMYDLPVSEDLPEGGFEYEIDLLEKPDSNVIQIPIESEGLNFYYQPIYTEEEITKLTNEGIFINRGTMGSYAVYTSEQKTNWVGGKEYKVGKVGQIHRPKMTDANGNWTWEELKIENGILTITIPQGFLDTAVYPVLSKGIKFGYETQGTAGGGSYAIRINSTTYLYNTVGSLYTASENFTPTSITLYLSNVSISTPVKAAIYATDLSKQYETESTNETTTGWKTKNISGASQLSADDYWLIGIADASGFTEDYQSVQGVYDNTGDSTYVSNGSYTLPESLTDSGGTSRWSIYATYTTDASSSCTYSGIGDFQVLYSDNCYFSSPVYVNGKFILINNGAGSLGVNAEISATGYDIGKGTGETKIDFGPSCNGGQCFASHK